MIVRTLLITLIATLLFSCGNNNTNGNSEGSAIEMKYSELLTMKQCDGYVYVQVRNPWDTTAILHSYVLIDRAAEIPDNLPKGDIVRTPLKKTVMYTSVHSAILIELGAYDCIKGVCDLNYINNECIIKDCAAGKIADLGEGTSPSMEGIINLSPDAIMLSPFQNNGTYSKLYKLNIPVIECADYMETSALGRAEWIRFYGHLVGRSHEADSIFASVETSYMKLKELASTAKNKPSVITDLKFGSTWYVPGGNSTMGRLMSDAATNYVFRERQENGSIPLDPEAVFERAMDADIWILKYNQASAKTYDEIAGEYANYSNMKAFKQKNIFGCNTSKVPFYEETPFHPDRLLKDFIKIFHPELLPDYSLRYYHKL